MFVPFTLFHVDRHLKKLDNHSQYSVEQIGSDCTRIGLRASVFQKFSGGAWPRTPLASAGEARTGCALRKTLSRPAPLIKKSSYASDVFICHHKLPACKFVGAMAYTLALLIAPTVIDHCMCTNWCQLF